MQKDRILIFGWTSHRFVVFVLAALILAAGSVACGFKADFPAVFVMVYVYAFRPIP